MTNTSQHKAVKRKYSQLINRVADNYDSSPHHYFCRTGDRLISLLKPAKGSNVLNIACGNSIVTSPVQAILA